MDIAEIFNEAYSNTRGSSCTADESNLCPDIENSEYQSVISFGRQDIDIFHAEMLSAYLGYTLEQAGVSLTDRLILAPNLENETTDDDTYRVVLGYNSNDYNTVFTTLNQITPDLTLPGIVLE